MKSGGILIVSSHQQMDTHLNNSHYIDYRDRIRFCSAGCGYLLILVSNKMTLNETVHFFLNTVLIIDQSKLLGIFYRFDYCKKKKEKEQLFSYHFQYNNPKC